MKIKHVLNTILDLAIIGFGIVAAATAESIQDIAILGILLSLFIDSVHKGRDTE